MCKELTEKIYPKALEYRRYLHSHPELSGEEKETAAFISSVLDELGIPNRAAAGHGVIGTLYGRARPEAGPAGHLAGSGVCPATIAIRADIDALPIREETGLAFSSVFPGKMHGCGHDLHTAVLLGTAALFAQIKDLLPGNLRLIFEPAEETVGGALPIIEAGALAEPDVSALLGLHVQPDLPAGSLGFVKGIMTAASCEFTLEVLGKGCHGAHPDSGSDPILAASSIICALQSIVSRNLPPTEAAVITVGSIESGTKGNIIPGNAVCCGIIRCLSESRRDFLKSRIAALSANIACGFGCICQAVFRDSYPALLNDSDLTELLIPAASRIFGRDKVMVSEQPSMGADDFAYFSREVPSLYFDLGVGHRNPSMNFPLHSPFFNPSEEAIRTGILAHAVSVLAILGCL